ncbi:MAG: FAD-binding oxidoreductase [Alphaproteobacteria bacterium]|nr:FAD-binding oxidoreductase [Alphaproteobacteria bacterium]
MVETNVKTLDGKSVAVAEEDIAALSAGLRGQVCLNGDDGYDEARTIWNAMVDKRPGMIVRCAGAMDVALSVKFASERNLLVAVRSGGHNIAGNAVCEGGLMIDLSRMTSVRVDPRNKTARVEPGATLGDVDKECQAHALAVPTGINSTTGIAGLTLGGGFGWTTRKYGMTIDSLLSVDMVTADGAMVHASGTENPDLFWAVRGGGGNFGIVTSFEFQAHPVGPEVLSGLIVHPIDQAPQLLKEYRRIVATAPDELTCWVVMRKAPPLPFIPEEWHGKEVLVFALCYIGDMAAGEKAAAELRALGNPIADVVSPHPFAGWQAAFDPLLTPGARNYWKSHDFNELSDGAIGEILDALARLPSPDCEVFIAQIGGKMSQIADNATAFPTRSAHFVMNVHTRWQETSDDAACIQWARDLFDATAPHAAGSVYVNFMPDDEGGRIAEAYGANHARLAQVKAKYDPGNLFRLNQNILPA